MKMYFLFGKAGAGKNYVGDFMQAHFNVTHFDADKLLTDEMKDFIANGKQFTQEMVNHYMSGVKEKIDFFYKNSADDSIIVISQAAYRNINRLDIMKTFPAIIFVMIDAKSDVCLARIKKRHHGVTATYAKAMEHYFELPDPKLNYKIIDNNEGTDELLFASIQALLMTEGTDR